MHVTSKPGRKLHIPTEAEDRAINAGIAQDPDAHELGAEFFANARPAPEALGKSVLESLKRGRGRPVGSVAEQTKEKVNLRLDPDVLDALRASGRGWQTRVNDLLRADIEAGRLKAIAQA